MTDRPYWCEICARKKECYGITLKPKCFVPTADRKTEPSNSEKPNNFDKDINVRSKDEPRIDCRDCKQWEYSGWLGYGCKRQRYDNKGCKFEPKDEPTTQMKTQNSNLTFEKDECAKEYEELGLKELKELIEADRKTENCSEKPNNCEHITEDGVTCARYPACDDCPDNPLNKVKGSERLVKGSEQTDCQTCKWWSSYGYCVYRECKGYEPQTERSE